MWEMHLLNCTEEGQISILSAKYGLMLEGRCNNNKSENTNCSDENDVRSFVKTKCEQRIDWEIELPDKKLDNMTLSTCPKSAIKTLEIAYWCKSSKFCCYYYIHVPCSVDIYESQIVIESKLN